MAETSVLGIAPLSLVAVVMVAAALGVALLLLGSASRRLNGATGSLRRASSLDLIGLRTELKANYNRLRRSGEAVPLASDVWRRFTASGETMPLAVRREVAQAYHAIEVSNRLLSASMAYDSRGVLSIRQRRMALWPTLEAAIRGALVALDCDVAPAVQVHARLLRQPDSTVKPAATVAPVAPAVSAPEAESVAAAALPKLSLFYGVEEAAPDAEQHDHAARTAATKSRRRPTRPQRQAADGQMALWESVA